MVWARKPASPVGRSALAYARRIRFPTGREPLKGRIPPLATAPRLAALGGYAGFFIFFLAVASRIKLTQRRREKRREDDFSI